MMKWPHTQIPDFRISAFILGLLLILLAPAANAITKHLSMVGENGQPLAETTITIKFQDGTSEQKDTDRKGILVFDFKKSGVYTLLDPAGNVIKTVSVAGSGLNSKVVTITALGAAAVLLIAAGSSSSDGSSGDPGTGDPGTGDPGTGDPGSGGGNEGSLGGTYNVTTSVASNPADHPVLLQNLVLQLQIIGTVLTIIQLSNNPNFPNQLSGTIVGGSFTASANGVYSGISTLFQLAGAISTLQQLSFLINIGSNGTLPTGQAITYDAQGTK